MAKEQPEKSDAAPAAVPMTVDDLAKLLPTLVQATAAAMQAQAPQVDTTAVQRAAAAAAAEMFERGTGTIKQNPDYPAISAFNREGDFANPRPVLHGHVFWVGTPLHAAELKREEIELVNALRPGEYHHGRWIVRDLAPGVTNPEHRRLSVEFQCRDNDQRQDLPKFVEMLREMVDASQSRLVVASA